MIASVADDTALEASVMTVAATVTATPEEVRLARELWRRLEQRYFGDGDHARRPVAAWCVGAD